MGTAEIALRVSLLNAAYARCIDSDRLEDWPQFFVDSCLYKIMTEEDHRRGYALGMVYADNRAMLVDRVTALRNANIFERHRYRHLIAMPALLDVAGQEVCAETAFAVFRIMRDGSSALFVSGRYLDKLRLVDEQTVKIVERLVICDSSTIDTLLVIPL